MSGNSYSLGLWRKNQNKDASSQSQDYQGAQEGPALWERFLQANLLETPQLGEHFFDRVPLQEDNGA